MKDEETRLECLKLAVQTVVGLKPAELTDKTILECADRYVLYVMGAEAEGKEVE